MSLETDPQRVRQLAADREEANWRFRRFLKFSDLPVRRIDAAADEQFRLVSGQIDCLACGNCCREMSPTLSRRDIHRLASALGLTARGVIQRYLQREEDDDSFTFAGRPCPFLSGNACTVYDSRPHDCRSFPHLHKKEFTSRLIGVIENCSVCPIVFNVFERLKAELWDAPDGDEDDWDWAGFVEQ